MPCATLECCASNAGVDGTHVATGEVTTLEHELGDDTVELGASIAVALLAGAESAEVLSGLGDDVVKELEVDAAGLVCRQRGVSNCIVRRRGDESMPPWGLSVWRRGAWLELRLTLDLASLGDVALVVDLDIGAGPGEIEVSLDNHVDGGWGEITLGGEVGGAESVGKTKSLAGEEHRGAAQQISTLAIFNAVSAKPRAPSLTCACT